VGTVHWLRREGGGASTQVEALLEIISQQLFYDPTMPDRPFNADRLVSILKAKDSALGP
jgi:hypothetical protein